MSLTRKLILLITSTVFMITLITAGWGFYVSNHQLDELFDAELAQSTRIVQGLVEHLSSTQSIEQLAFTLSKTLELPDALFQGDEEEDEILPDGAGHKYERKIAFEVWSPDQQPVLDTLRANDAQGLEPGFAWQDAAAYQGPTVPIRDPPAGF